MQLHLPPFLADALVRLPLELGPEPLLQVVVEAAFIEHLFSDLRLEVGVRLLLQFALKLVVDLLFLSDLEFLEALLADFLLQEYLLSIELLPQLMLLILQRDLVVPLHLLDLLLDGAWYAWT